MAWSTFLDAQGVATHFHLMCSLECIPYPYTAEMDRLDPVGSIHLATLAAWIFGYVGIPGSRPW